MAYMEVVQGRLKTMAIGVAVLCDKLPGGMANRAYASQVIRSSSSSAANYRAACRAKSVKDFINKLKIVEEELDEIIFFLEMLCEVNTPFQECSKPFMKAAPEHLAMIGSAIKTTKAKFDG
jgi:four helix bundle protein